MKKQQTTSANIGAAAAASNGHLKGFQQYETPIPWATALAAGLPYFRWGIADLFAGSGKLLQGAANDTTTNLYSLELDPDVKPFRRVGSQHHFSQGDFNDWIPLAEEVGVRHDILVMNPPGTIHSPSEAGGRAR